MFIKRRQWGWEPGVRDEFEKEGKDQIIYDLDRNLRNLDFSSSCNGVAIREFITFSECQWNSSMGSFEDPDFFHLLGPSSCCALFSGSSYIKKEK